jgi:hypothetical protein
MAKTQRKLTPQERKLTPQERGRLGGLATVKKYGTEHMRQIGRRGFAALVRKLGGAWNPYDPGNAGRRRALEQLVRLGRIRPRRPFPPQPTPEDLEQQQRDFEELFDELTRDLDLAPRENPVVNHVLASIKAAPLPELPL